MPIKIFFCYAREDEALLKKLKTHLRPLQRQGLIEVWYDRDISAGAEWEQEIKEHLDTAQIILLLVSPDFMDSEYCYSIEMKRALERHANGEAKVIPIIFRPVYWHGEPLGKLNALPTDGKPVTSQDWRDQDSAFYDITNGLYKVVRQYISPFLAEKLTLLRTLTGHTGFVWSVALSADSQTLVSGSWDKTIKVQRGDQGQRDASSRYGIVACSWHGVTGTVFTS